MCKVIDSETVLKSYFKKYPKRSIITYQHLKEIRSKAEPAIRNTYIDITYSSLRSAKSSYPDSIQMESQKVRVINPVFKREAIADMSVYHELEAYL